MLPRELGSFAFQKKFSLSTAFGSVVQLFSSFRSCSLGQLSCQAGEICLCNGLLALPPGHSPRDDSVSHPLELGLLPPTGSDWHWPVTQSAASTGTWSPSNRVLKTSETTCSQRNDQAQLGTQCHRLFLKNQHKQGSKSCTDCKVCFATFPQRTNVTGLFYSMV